MREHNKLQVFEQQGVLGNMCGPTTDEDSNLGCCVVKNLGSLCKLYDITEAG
jgi:hypothetical protein